VLLSNENPDNLVEVEVSPNEVISSIKMSGVKKDIPTHVYAFNANFQKTLSG
jgi:hypothetical protein